MCVCSRLCASQRHVSGEGTHFRIPWLQMPHIFDVRIRPRNISSNTGTKDLQVVTINLRVLSRPEEEHLPDIFSQLGVDYDERVLPSIGNEVLKAVVAQYNAESLITKRELVSACEPRRVVWFHLSLPVCPRRAGGLTEAVCVFDPSSSLRSLARCATL